MLRRMHRRPASRRGADATLRNVLATLALLPLVAAGSCKSSSDPAPVDPGVDAGPSACAIDGCQEPNDKFKSVRFTPSTIVLAKGETRPVRVYLEPDVCTTTVVPIASDTPSVATALGGFTADPCTAEKQLDISGIAPGSAKITAKFGSSVATLTVAVLDSTPVACSGDAAKGNLGPGKTLNATWGAALSVNAGAVYDPTSIDPLDKASAVDPFDATISCAPATPPAGMIALGPAVSFGPAEKRFLREIVFEIPVNPALLPPTAKLKHVRVQFSSTSLKTPRFVPVANARFEPRGDHWVYRFEAPRLGTYQVFVAADAGTHKRKRTLTHRAVFGFSMGGIGASMFGMNHHDLFDVVSPLGGPLDATWFLDYFYKYHFGGFCPRKAGDPVPTTPCHLDVGPPTEIFEKVQDFEHWWHLDVAGTGGTFAREEYVSIFRDVSAMWGDPGSENKKWPQVAAGIDPPAPFNAKTVDYCNDPAKSTIAKTGFYDRNFNPDGAQPVIKFCDGANVPGKPDQWAPGGTEPMEVVVAVDYNHNGARDEGEPVIIQGYEPFSDVGNDGLGSKNEPGYDPITNPDPNGDDYDQQYNPLGPEGNHRREEKEPFEDLGLDGVACPSPGTCVFDTGEGDGKFTMSAGLQTFLARDGRSQINGWSPAPPGGAWDDAALDNLDYYSDGGIRDIFNWGLVGDHYAGAFAGRNRPLAYYNDWKYLPNVNVTDNDSFDQKTVDWSALPQAVYLRYGDLDASERDIQKGDGQHVGSASQVIRRIETALFYIGSRWPDADTAYAEDPPDTTDPEPCAGTNSCTFSFTAKDGRTGPTTVILPPGYHSDAAKGLRYPVVYFLHGYGQTPEDLKALVLVVSPLMGEGLSSRATRLQKMIMVFVDGRCRGPADKPECVNGTFYVNSNRPDGPQIDNYFRDLMGYVDGKWRTMPTTQIEVTD